MSEWSKEPDSKSGVVLCITEGSNPSLSEEMGRSLNILPLERCPSGRRCTIGSRVWSKAIGGSNPPLSVFQQQILGYVRRPTPSGQGCSSGKRKAHETRTICCCFFFRIMPAALIHTSENLQSPAGRAAARQIAILSNRRPYML